MPARSASRPPCSKRWRPFAPTWSSPAPVRRGHDLWWGRQGHRTHAPRPRGGLETRTGLKAPETQNIVWLCFSRDGNQLAAACANQVIQVWDLRHLRQELATRGLDWERQPWSPPL